MDNNPNNDRKIAIADYRWKYLLYAAVCWGLVLAGFLAFGAKERHWQFWIAEVVMLIFALGISYMLINKKYEFIGRTGPKFEAYLEQRYEGLLTENGRFIYGEEGFVFHAGNTDVPVKWHEITRISAHLEDVVTNDEDLCLKLEYGDGHFLEFDEEIEGWLLFRQKLGEHFSLPADWEKELIASGDKELLLFSRS